MTLRFAKYELGVYAVNLMVGTRPDFNDKETRDFVRDGGVEVFMAVTDQFPGTMHEIPSIWCPWVEELPPNEMMVAAVKNLNTLIQDSNYENIYLHCDAGTHRSPTIFGLWLLAYNKPKEWGVPVELVKDHWSDPLRYADTYMKDPKCPWVPEAMRLLGVDTMDSVRSAIALAASHKYNADEDPMHFLKGGGFKP